MLERIEQLCAWETDPFLDEPRYAVKIVPSGSQEADIYDQLHRLDPASPNHTLPCTIVDGEVRFLIMPCLEHILARPDRLELGLGAMLRLFRQVLEVGYILSILDSLTYAEYRELNCCMMTTSCTW